MPNSLIDFRDWSKEQIQDLIEDSIQLEKRTDRSFQDQNRTVALLFFESSTRTRISFELACFREGFHPLSLSAKSGTSLDKGETVEDTLENVAAMKPDLLVVRSDENLDQHAWSQKLKIPMISAGWGKRSHPTQALLDVRSVLKKGISPSQMRVVIVGDIAHSRVAHSHFELSKKIGYELAVLSNGKCELPSHVMAFSNLEEAFSWGNVMMSLRYQTERHEEKMKPEEMKKWQISQSLLRTWKKDGLLMHPGPVNWGFELSEDLRQDSKNIILDQVESGVWIRRACVNHFLRRGT